MHFIALHDIPAEAELNISYIPLIEPRSIRQKKLLSDYHFKCLCAGCRPKPKKEISEDETNNGSASNNGDNTSSEELFTSQKRKKKRSRWLNNGNNRHQFTPSTINNGTILYKHVNTVEEDHNDCEVDEFQRDFVCQVPECEGKGLIYKTTLGQRLCNLCLHAPEK